jgi:uncharacterized protein YceK
MYKILLLCVIATLLLSGCTSIMTAVHGERVHQLEVNFEKEYFQARSEQNDIHKANSIKYVPAGKTVILQAALASLMELGFHINNQDIALGVLSGTVDKSSSFMDTELRHEDKKYRDKLIDIVRQQYAGCCIGDTEENFVETMASRFNTKLADVSVNVMVIERDDDSQVSVKITYATSQEKVSDYWRSVQDTFAQFGMIPKEIPEYTLPPNILRIAYKRIWDAIEKQLFLQNIILNR